MTTTVAGRAHQRQRKAQLLDALGDGESRTASWLAAALFGPGRSGMAVQYHLCALEKAGAIVRAGHIWTPPQRKTRATLWRTSAPPPPPPPPPTRLAKAPAALRIEKGIAPDDLAWMHHYREQAARRAAWRAGHRP